MGGAQPQPKHGELHRATVAGSSIVFMTIYSMGSLNLLMLSWYPNSWRGHVRASPNYLTCLPIERAPRTAPCQNRQFHMAIRAENPCPFRWPAATGNTKMAWPGSRARARKERKLWELTGFKSDFWAHRHSTCRPLQHVGQHIAPAQRVDDPNYPGASRL